MNCHTMKCRCCSHTFSTAEPPDSDCIPCPECSKPICGEKPGDEIAADHPVAWYDDDRSGGWWAQGHLTPEDFIAAASEYDADMDMDSLEGWTLEHLWRSDCHKGRFETDNQQSDDYPHPVTRLV